ncbi:MAG TPA: glycine cleavage system protein GcvH [Sedimentisphaerales bacterium]|nr:glycine cleavage system protein GcvH [Sedimentisphaerales bacterium]
MIIEGLLYTKDHEWLKIEGDEALIGITDYAQQMLGEVIFVELPAVGTKYSQHGELAVAESTKAASDIYSPVAGKVTEINDAVEATPELINQDCYGDGWICRIAIADKKETKTLMDWKQYGDYLKGL